MARVTDCCLMGFGWVVYSGPLASRRARGVLPGVARGSCGRNRRTYSDVVAAVGVQALPSSKPGGLKAKERMAVRRDNSTSTSDLLAQKSDEVGRGCGGIGVTAVVEVGRDRCSAIGRIDGDDLIAHFTRAAAVGAS